MNQAAQQFGLPVCASQECDGMLARLNNLAIVELKLKLTQYMGEPQKHQPESFKRILAQQRNFCS